MTFNESTDLAVFAKELFSKTTDAQAAVVRDLFTPFPDAAFARGLLSRLATETTILPTPMIRAELQAELRRRNETSEAYAKQQQRMEDMDAVRQRKTVDALIADFSDEDLEALKPKALEVLRGKLDANGIEFVEKHIHQLNPRRSFLLKAAIFKALQPTAA